MSEVGIEVVSGVGGAGVALLLLVLRHFDARTERAALLTRLIEDREEAQAEARALRLQVSELVRALALCQAGVMPPGGVPGPADPAAPRVPPPPGTPP